MTTPRTRDPATPATRSGWWSRPPSWPSAPPWSKTVELLVGLATRFGPERAAAGARAAVGPDRLAAALAATPTSALTRGARAELHARPDLRDLLARLVAPS